MDQRGTDGGDDAELDPDYVPEGTPEDETPNDSTEPTPDETNPIEGDETSPVERVEIVHNTATKEATEKTTIRKPESVDKKQDRITDTIHQIWWQGQDKIPEHYHKLVQSWKDLHPGTRYILWDEKMITSLIENHPALNPFVNIFHQYKVCFRYILTRSRK